MRDPIVSTLVAAASLPSEGFSADFPNKFEYSAIFERSVAEGSEEGLLASLLAEGTESSAGDNDGVGVEGSLAAWPAVGLALSVWPNDTKGLCPGSSCCNAEDEFAKDGDTCKTELAPDACPVPELADCASCDGDCTPPAFCSAGWLTVATLGRPGAQNCAFTDAGEDVSCDWLCPAGERSPSG